MKKSINKLKTETNYLSNNQTPCNTPDILYMKYQ